MNNNGRVIGNALVALFLSALAGCATPRSWAQLDLQDMKGEMTYEQATDKLGPPSRCYDQAALRTCDWIFDHRGRLVMTMPGMTKIPLPYNGRLARLVFAENRLSDWTLSGRW